MPQYFLTLPHDSAEEPTMESMDPAALQEVFAAVDGFNTKLKDDGAWVFAGGLHPPSAATTVDATGDTPILTDGPYVEAKEYLGGFWIIEAPDLDAAIEYATLGSKALQGRIEVRPFQEVRRRTSPRRCLGRSPSRPLPMLRSSGPSARSTAA